MPPMCAGPSCRVVSAGAASCLPWTQNSSGSVLTGQSVSSSDAYLYLSTFSPLAFPPVSASRCATTAHRLSVFCRQQALRTSLSCVLLRQTSSSLPRFLAEETIEKSGQTQVITLQQFEHPVSQL